MVHLEDEEDTLGNFGNMLITSDRSPGVLGNPESSVEKRADLLPLDIVYTRRPNKRESGRWCSDFGNHIVRGAVQGGIPFSSLRVRQTAEAAVATCLTGAEKEDGNANAVLDSGGRGPEKKVSDKAVAVGAHGDKVTAFVLNPLDNLVRRFAVGEFGIGWDVFGLEFGLDAV